MRLLTAATLLTVSLVVNSANAGKFNEVLSVGDKAPDWTALPDVVSGKNHALADLKEYPVVIVFFTCNSCLVSNEYEDRVLRFAAKYGVGAPGNDPSAVAPTAAHGKVAMVALNVNKVKDDLPPAMKARATKKKYPFPYLFDETQKIARDYGAIATPEFFVLDRDRHIVYMGALDDSSDEAKVKINYLEAAVAATLSGKRPETSETAPSGCRIRYARVRR